MVEHRRFEGLLQPLRGVAFVIGLGLVVVLVAAAIAAVLARVMT